MPMTGSDGTWMYGFVGFAAIAFTGCLYLLLDEKKKNKRKTLSKKEMFIDLYLDNTCKIVGKLNNNDIEMMENVKKTKQQTINLDNEIEKE